MATQSLRSIRDQNLDILYTGATPIQKMDLPKADKKARLAGRKALNDISNSRKPSSVLPNLVKKSVISIEEDPVAVKAKLPKETGKGKVGGRKALTDVTNSVIPPAKNTCRKFEEEGFLHNHQECIKAQAKAVELDMEYFLKSVGLHKDVPMQPTFARKVPLASKKPQFESSKEDLQIEEMVLSEDEEVLLCRSPACHSPACHSPQSLWAPCVDWGDDELFDLKVIGT